MVTPPTPPGGNQVNAPQAVAGDGDGAARRVRRRVERSGDADARVRAHHRAAGDAGAVDVRLPAVASHARGPGTDPRRSRGRSARRSFPATRSSISAPTSRRRAGTRTTASSPGIRRTFPDPKKMVDALHAEHMKVVLHIAVEGRTFTGGVNDPCTAPPIPPGRLPNAQGQSGRVAARSAGLVLLAGAQAAVRRRRRRLVAGSGRRLRRDLAPGAHPHVLGRQPDVPAERAAVRAASQRLRRHGALRRVPLVGRRLLDVGDARRRTCRSRSTPRSRAFRYWGTDIGGFVPTPEYTGELHVRWFQFGAFNPLFRAHGRTWQLRLPWGWNRGTVGISEVAGYGGGAGDPAAEHLNDARVEPICRKYLELRYRLMPYLYSAVRECAETGMPIIRALWLHYPDDPAAVATRRSVPLGPRHPRRARRRERRDVAQGLSAARRLVRLLDERARRRRPRDRSRGRSRDDAALRARRRDRADGPGAAVHG